MRRIRTEIEAALIDLNRDDRSLTARFHFPDDFIGFHGHFPDGRLLPGACQIQCVLTLIEKGYSGPVILREIMLAKYAVPVLPGDQVDCVVTQTGEADGMAVFRSVASRNGEKISEIKLRVSLPPAAGAVHA